MSKVITIILLLSLIFYIILFILIIGSIGTTVPANPYNTIVRSVIGIGGVIMLTVSFLTRTLNGFLNEAYYSGNMIQPLAEAEMITNKIAKVNKNKVPIRALLTNITLTFLFAFTWVILPLILGQNVEFASMVGFNSLTMFIMNGYVMVGVIYLFSKKILKTNYAVIGTWTISLAILLWQDINYFVQWGDNKWQLITFLAVTAFAILWYFIYIRKKYKNKPRPALPKPYLEREVEEIEIAQQLVQTQKLK